MGDTHELRQCILGKPEVCHTKAVLDRVATIESGRHRVLTKNA
jgi:hypothetical protein